MKKQKKTSGNQFANQLILKHNELLKKYKFPVTLLSGNDFHDLFLRGMGEVVYKRSKKAINEVAGICYSNLPPLKKHPTYLPHEHKAALNFEVIQNWAKEITKKGSNLSLDELCEILVLTTAAHEMGHTQYTGHCKDSSCMFSDDNSGISYINHKHIFVCCPCKKHSVKHFDEIKKVLSLKYGEKIVWGDTKAKREMFIHFTTP